jgi:stage III sporulation protein SpoIIIAA
MMEIEQDDAYELAKTLAQEGTYNPEHWENGYFDYLEWIEYLNDGSYDAVWHDVERRTVVQLKDILRDRGLKVTGRRKEELIERLLTAYNAHTEREGVNPSDLLSAQQATTPDKIINGHSEPQKEESDAAPTNSTPLATKQREVVDVEYCFDTANNYRLVQKHELERLGRLDDAAQPDINEEDTSVSYEAQTLLDLLPTEMTENFPPELVPNLMEIVLDVGKRPFCWVNGDRHFLGDMLVTQEQLEHITCDLHFGPDNRAGMNGSLHRISAIRNREDECIGLTMRVGRFVPGNALMIADILAGMPSASILIVGDPGSGKTSIVRDVARFLAERHSLLIIDTSCEIGGSGDVPHECIGLSRRMQVKTIDTQARTMIECVQNHTPGVMVIDEIGREAEVTAALTCKERGVRMVASAHGNLAGLVRNSTLCDLVGGVDIVTVGDMAAKKDAKRRGQNGTGIASKLKAQRRGPPIFDVIIEVKRGYLHEWHVVLHSATAVDSILSDGTYETQARFRENNGARTIRTKKILKQATNVEDITEKGPRSGSILNTIPNNTHSEPVDLHDLPGDLNPYNDRCTTCPICDREFINRNAFVSHALSKRDCLRELPNDLRSALALEDRRRR